LTFAVLFIHSKFIVVFIVIHSPIFWDFTFIYSCFRKTQHAQNNTTRLRRVFFSSFNSSCRTRKASCNINGNLFWRLGWQKLEQHIMLVPSHSLHVNPFLFWWRVFSACNNAVSTQCLLFYTFYSPFSICVVCSLMWNVIITLWLKCFAHNLRCMLTLCRIFFFLLYIFIFICILVMYPASPG
jgi:hypothetical protein